MRPGKAAIAFVVGTRPEAIKLAPVILRARRDQNRLRCIVVSTGQQADLVGPALSSFGLVPDIELNVMRPGQSLADLTSRCLTALAPVLRDVQPRAVVVQGDTTSALAGALAAFYGQIPVAHVEAGLRTGNSAAPFPEEANRQLIGRLANLHFAPTLDAKAHLLSEGIDAESIEVTGNTIVDALTILRPQILSTALPEQVRAGAKIVLVTAHRRENLGRRLHAICDATRRLARLHPELCFVFVMHANPIAGETTRERLGKSDRVVLLAPQPYLEMLKLLHAAWLVLTDSGGLQEEAPSFATPVLVLRDCTERMESLSLGFSRLVGADPARIMAEVGRLLDSAAAYRAMTPTHNPYGDGTAADRIANTLIRFVGIHRNRSAA